MTAAAKKKPTLQPEIEFFPDVEQRSAEWHDLRRGLPTASRFAAVLAEGDGKTRAKYMNQLAGEILTGETAETFRNEAMDRGLMMEPDARDFYARTQFVDLAPMGFVRRRLPSGRFVGCSPDSMIGKRKALEIKTTRPDLLIELARRGTFPSEHRAQTHGTLWVAGLDEIDLMIFYRGMPVAPTFTIERNDAYLREISEAVEIFDWELHKLVEQMREMGR